jgi:2-C-methyl-D-erythritol 4-phosphate cytidylyltransferase / 2-C-methyl-D-erythritol 2,4-cyclodiphosphate synthase
MAFAAVVVAAGKSLRFGGLKKEYRLLDGVPVLARSLSIFLDMEECLSVVAVVPPGGVAEARLVLGDGFLEAAGSRLSFAEGGAERTDSVLAGLRALEALEPGTVLIHDAARPWADAALVGRVLAGATEFGACIPGVPVGDTIKQIGSDGFVSGHPSRPSLRAIQTPQGFAYQKLFAAYLAAGPSAAAATDDAEVWARTGGRVFLVEGDRRNSKITFPEDLP